MLKRLRDKRRRCDTQLVYIPFGTAACTVDFQINDLWRKFTD